MNYSNIKAYIEEKISVISELSAVDASQVAVMAFQLVRFNQSPDNLADLLTYLQSQENSVDNTDAIKSVTLLLGASTPSKAVIWRMQEFLTDGDFTVPDNIAGGLVYVTGVGGGGSGSAGVRASTNRLAAMGGFGGQYCIKKPVNVNAGDVIAVTIGDGGLPVTANASVTTSTSGNDGGDSSFGSLVLSGGSGGRTTNDLYTHSKYGGGQPGIFNRDIAGTVIASNLPNVVNGYSGGTTSYSATGQSTFATGGGAGPFGEGGMGVVSDNDAATGENAGDNSGAGGGGACISVTSGGPYLATSGAGGSGRIVVEWQEYI